VSRAHGKINIERGCGLRGKRRCRQRSETPDLRTQAQAIKANVVCYLIKPFAADELLACVRRAVQRHDVGVG
jgi:DNA-binding response OmpR family regulator